MAVSSKAPNRSIPGRPSFQPEALCERHGSAQIVLKKSIRFALAVSAVPHAVPCDGRRPDRAGQAFSGQVRYIGDGDGLCVGDSTNPSTWIEVRLADVDAPR
jgi:endonuclease YncB( thermonuclease family)